MPRNLVKYHEVMPQQVEVQGDPDNEETIEQLRYEFGLPELTDQKIWVKDRELWIVSTLVDDPLLSQVHALRSFVMHKFVFQNLGQISNEAYDSWVEEHRADYDRVVSLIRAGERYFTRAISRNKDICI